jgi:hypothetical protein
VFCSGVLYHVPDPVFSLTQLRRICRKTLILTTASIVDRPDLPNAAVLLAALSPEQRRQLAYPTPYAKLGLDSDFELDRGYANWVWLPTPGCVRAMLVLAGFSVDEFYPSRRVTTVVASPTEATRWGATK